MMGMWTRPDARFLASTRGRVAALLRRAPRTVDDLAGALRITRNAVRSHLTTLERDGLVRQVGVRRGESKPFHLYELTPEAERLFPKPYGALVGELLGVLGERLGTDTLDQVLYETGRRLGDALGRVPGDLPVRVRAAADLLNDLGGLTEVEERADGWIIRGFSCPLAAAVAGHPRACLVAEALLAEVIGVPVRQTCNQGEPLQCEFAVRT